MYIDPRSFSAEAIDASTRAANEMIEKMLAEAPPLNEVPIGVTRDARKSGRGLFPPPTLLPSAETRTIRGLGGDLPLRIFRHAEPRGVYLHFHGGSHAIGSADRMEPTLDALSRAARATVVSVEYRLAPEHPYPSGPDDCEAAAVWLAENAARELGAASLAIGGEFAGAQLSAITLLRMRDRHGAMPFCAANLVYGCYDAELTPSVRRWPPALAIPLGEAALRRSESFVADALAGEPN
jgi:acetyl esterase/lipase